MSLFNDLEDVSSSSYGESQYLTKGINQNVTIGPLSYHSNVDAGKAPFITFNLYKTASGEEKGTNFKLYMSENAKKRSLAKLSHMSTAIITKDALLEINKSSNSIEEFLASLNAVIAGKEIKFFKFCAEQYLNASNEIKDSIKIGFPPFAAQAEPHNLKYSDENPFDYVKVAAVVGNKSMTL